MIYSDTSCFISYILSPVSTQSVTHVFSIFAVGQRSLPFVKFKQIETERSEKKNLEDKY